MRIKLIAVAMLVIVGSLSLGVGPASADRRVHEDVDCVSLIAGTTCSITTTYERTSSHCRSLEAASDKADKGLISYGLKAVIKSHGFSYKNWAKIVTQALKDGKKAIFGWSAVAMATAFKVKYYNDCMYTKSTSCWSGYLMPRCA